MDKTDKSFDLLSVSSVFIGANLPINFPLLRGVDLCKLDALVVEENLHVIEEKLVRAELPPTMSRQSLRSSARSRAVR